MNLWRKLGRVAGWMLVLAMVSAVALAQADFPFRDPKLGDDQRIADLLGRLTLDEKVNLMSDHPKIPRLGRPRQNAAADDDLSAGKRTRRNLGSGTDQEDCRRGGLRGAVRLSESIV